MSLENRIESSSAAGKSVNSTVPLSVILTLPSATSRRAAGYNRLLGLDHARCKCVRVIVRQHRDRSLSDQRTFIHPFGDKMYAASVQSDLVRKDPLMRVEPGKALAAGRVDIDHRAQPFSNEIAGQQRMYPGEANYVGLHSFESRLDLFFVDSRESWLRRSATCVSMS